MTLALSRQHEITIEAFSELTTTNVALQHEGMLGDDQPVAKVVDDTGVHEVRISDILSSAPEADEVADRFLGEPLTYEGDDGEVCLTALRHLARSRRGYHQSNAVRMLREKGMRRTARVCQAISVVKTLVSPEVSVETSEPAIGEVVLDHDIDYLPDLTPAQIKYMERLIERENERYRDLAAVAMAKPVAAPEERDPHLAEAATGAIPVVGPAPLEEASRAA